MIFTYKTTDDAIIHLRWLLKNKDKDLTNKEQLQSLVQETIDIWNQCKEATCNWHKLLIEFHYIKNNPDKITRDDLLRPFLMLNCIYNTKLAFKNIEALTYYFAVQEPNLIKTIIDETKTKSENVCNANAYLSRVGLIGSHSFLSKFYCILNPSCYPIVDSLAIKALNNLLSITPKLGTRYCDFVDAINTLKEKLHLKEGYRELDKFLWLYGKTLK